MHPVILQDLASQHARDMQLTATVAGRARRARRARRGHLAVAVPAAAVRYGTAVRHA
jgi:hypothetical protein